MKCLLISVIFIIIFLACAVFIPLAAAIEHPRGYADICFSCHGTILTEKETNSKLGRCSCHSLDVDDFAHSKQDENKLSSIHEDLCAKCHTGIGYTPEDFARLVHLPHGILECSRCHGEGNITVPDAKNCNNCHIEDVHDVHHDIVEDLCVGCHGKAINKFPELEEGKGIIVETPEEEPGGFSLYDLLKFLFPLVFGNN
ncbi:MAG: hypothetical protein R6U44_12135 [Archaeoglobaceae archaeon]